MERYKEIYNIIENIIKNDSKAMALYMDIMYKSKTNKLKDEEKLHPFITYIFDKIHEIYGKVDPKDVKKGLIHFYSKNVIGIDADLW
jgi:hypothetical protein